VGYELAGDSFFGRENFSEANSYYRKAYDISKTSDLTIKISMASIRSGKEEEGVRILKSWLKDHQSDVKAYQVLGTTLQNMGQNSEAITIYEKALNLQPDNFVVLNNLAGLYVDSDRTHALELADKAYNLNPENAAIKDTYGWILLQQGQVDKGFLLIKDAYEQLSGLAEVRFHYASALIKTGRKEEGMEMLNNLLRDEKEFKGREEAEKMLR